MTANHPTVECRTHRLGLGMRLTLARSDLPAVGEFLTPGELESGSQHEPHKLDDAGSNPAPATITQNKAGCVSNGEGQAKRDGYLYTGIEPSRTKASFSGGGYTYGDSPCVKTGYVSLVDNRQVAQPILF